MMVVNRANAYKLSGNVTRAKQIMEAYDWTATSDLFQLAAAALENDIVRMVRLIKKIGKNSEDVTANDYREWPLFARVREDAEFNKAFKAVFREPLSLPKTEVPGDLEHAHQDDVHGQPMKAVSRVRRDRQKDTVH